MNAQQTVARVDAIVSQIALAQIHGAKGVLAEAIRDGAHLSGPVHVALALAEAAVQEAEKAVLAVATAIEGSTQSDVFKVGGTFALDE
jgi:hypothetical protein